MEMDGKTILIIEDDLDLSDLLKERIADLGYNLIFVHTASDAISCFSKIKPSLMLLDLSLPDLNGKDLIYELIKLNYSLPPFIVATGKGDERIAVEMMKLGAKDYLIKDRNFLDLISIVISRVIKEYENESKLKIAEQALIESNQFNKQIIASASEGIVVYDINFRYQVWNTYMEVLTGLSAAKVLYKKPNEVFEFIKESDLLDDFYKAISGEILPERDLPFFFPDSGKSGWASVTIAPLFDSSGSVTGVINTIRDISKRKETEKLINLKNDELVKLNIEKDKFFSIIAHDLRSPFNAFLGFTTMMVEDLPSLKQNEIQEIAIEMRKSAFNLFGLLENLLEWSRIRGGTTGFEPRKFKLTSLSVENQYSLFETAKSKNIKITVNIPDNTFIYADENMISSTIRNLISNALKFSKTGGRVSLDVGDSGNGFVEISVRDNGIGMNKELLRDLFRIDVQTKRKGTSGEPSAGLGLLLCKEFVEKMGGEIKVESEEGQGSTFRFTVPKEEKKNSNP
jgi:PAS domain S-box-containing protein